MKMTDHSQHNNSSNYQKNSLTLVGAVSMGTGVMIGAGILALTGQIAELAGSLFPLAFFAAAIVTAFSAYSYVKLSNAYPSAGGIAMFLQKAYGKGVMTAAGALLMYFSMVINQSLVAKTSSLILNQGVGLHLRWPWDYSFLLFYSIFLEIVPLGFFPY